MDARTRPYELPQARLVRPGPNDEEVGVDAGAGSVNQRVDALEALEATDIQEVGPFMRSRRAGPVVALYVDEQREHLELTIEPAVNVHLRREATWRKKKIDVRGRPREGVRIPPQLRRPLGGKGAPQTIGLFARAAVELPEDVRGTDEPVLVSGIDLDRRTPSGIQRQDARAEQGHVVEMNHVVRAAVENSLNLFLLEVRASRLVRGRPRNVPGMAK